MDPVVWIAAAVGIIGVGAYAFNKAVNKRVARALKQQVPAQSTLRQIGKPLPSASTSKRRSAECEAIRQKLRPALMYDEAKIDRLIEMEQSRTPTAPEKELYAAAYEQWVRDNR